MKQNKHSYDPTARKLAEESSAADSVVEKALRKSMGGGLPTPEPGPSPFAASSAYGGSAPGVKDRGSVRRSQRSAANGANMGKVGGNTYDVSSMTWRIICDDLADEMQKLLRSRFGMRLSIQGQATMAEVLQEELLGHVYVVHDERRLNVDVVPSKKGG